jgi:hypothetical protein
MVVVEGVKPIGNALIPEMILFGWWIVSSAGFPNLHLLGVCRPNLFLTKPC